MADNRKLAAGLRNLPASAREDLAGREQDIQRGKTVELLRRAGKEMYENPIVNTAVGLSPVLGDIQAAGETMAALGRGAPWQETAGYAAGMLPFVPMIGKTAIKKMSKDELLDILAADKTLTPKDPRFVALSNDEKMKLAQKTAALPEFGFPAENTAIERSALTGHTDPWYHGRYSDYEEINPDKTFYVSKDPSYAGIYAMEPTASSMGGKSVDYENLQPNMMPVMIRPSDILDTRTTTGKKVFDKDFYMKYGNASELTEKKVPDWVEGEDFRDMFADTGSKYKGVYLDEGKVPTWEGGLKDRGISTAIFDPSTVRSKFAAFNPRFKNEPGLLLGAGSLGIYGALQGEDEYQ